MYWKMVAVVGGWEECLQYNTRDKGKRANSKLQIWLWMMRKHMVLNPH